MKQCRGCKNNYDQRYADYCFVCNDGDRYKPTDAVLKKRNRKPKVKTNADRIRSMTDEELAEWISSEPPCKSQEWWNNWLKQEVKE